MSVFNMYSEYYDLLYKDKDYNSEVDYIDSLIKKHKPEAKSIIDFGCGTGNHDMLFYKKGYEITGTDLSFEMIEIAKLKAIGTSVLFRQGDIRNTIISGSYDVAVSLFHVISYQNLNLDVINSFINVNRHLSKNGVFIFDFWYGPGVLNDQPTTRVKRLENDNLKVSRITESALIPNSNTVDVNFEINVLEKKTAKNFQINETHSMRYFFYPELEYFLIQSGFKVLDFYEWNKFIEPTLNSWNAVLICKKKND
jgi:SAM-dependent methyltransferase